MNDDEFRKHLYKLMAEEKKNQSILTNRLYPQKDNKKDNKHSYSKPKKN